MASLEQAIKDLTAAVAAQTAAVIGNTAVIVGQVGSAKPASNDGKKLAAVKTEAKATETPKADTPAADAKVTYESVKAKLMAFIRTPGNGTPVAKQVLKPFGIETLFPVAEEKDAAKKQSLIEQIDAAFDAAVGGKLAELKLAATNAATTVAA